MKIIFSLLVIPFLSVAQDGHYVSSPKIWDGEFKDDFSLCVMNREYEIAAFGNLLNGVPHGRWLYLREDSIIKEEGFYKKGLRHGEWISYDVHGSIQSKGKYKKGKLHGNWSFYDEVRVYKNGNRIQ